MDGAPSGNVKMLLALKKALGQGVVQFVGAPDDLPGVRLTQLIQTHRNKFTKRSQFKAPLNSQKRTLWNRTDGAAEGQYRYGELSVSDNWTNDQ